MIEELKAKGWYLSSEGLEMCKEGLDRVNLMSIQQKAVDSDLRDISEPYLSDDIYKNKMDSSITGPCVLQIQKLKNVSVPKYDSGSNNPLLLRLLLTDGHLNVSCLQWGYWKSINLDTPPGTKIFVKPVKISIQNGLLLLRETHFSVLGGRVPAMVEKWELTKHLALHRRGEGSEDGPPPWIPFGNSIKYKDPKVHTGNFRSLEQDAKEQKENAVFKQQRMATIAEVSKVKEGKVKVFGGGKDKPTSLKNENNSYEQPSTRTAQQTNPTPAKNSNYSKPEASYRNGEKQNFSTTAQSHKKSDYNTYRTERDTNRNQGQKFEGYRNYDTDKTQRTDSKYNEPRKQYPQRTEFRSGNNRSDNSKSNSGNKDLSDMMAQMNIRNQGRQDVAPNLPLQNHPYLKPQADVLARYWEDKKFYRAVVHAVGENGTCVVFFVDYGNYEEVRLSDIRPMSANWNGSQDMNNLQYSEFPQNQNFSGGFRDTWRGGNRSQFQQSGNNNNYFEKQRERTERQDHRPTAKLYQPPQQRQS